MPNISIYLNPGDLAQAAAEHFIYFAAAAIQARNRCFVVLAGGSTPQVLYSLLASETYRQQVDWSKLHIFWGDERCVPPDHPESNYHKASQALLGNVPVLPENVHRIPAEFEPERAAGVYEETLLAYFSSLLEDEDRFAASFDLVLLGMGDDGHTASLFPGMAAVHEHTRWVTAHYVDKLAAWRITLTPAILNRAREVLFMVSGAVKSNALQHVLYGSYQPDRYPAQVIQPEHGQVSWLVDEEAAYLL